MSEVRTINEITLVDFEGIENITKFKYRTTLPKYPKPGTFYWIEQNIDGEPKLGIYFVTNDCELVRLDSKIYDLVINDSDGYLRITDKDEFDTQTIYLIIGNFEKEDEIIDDGTENGTRVFKITKEENKGLATVEATVEYVSDSNNMLYMSNAEDYWWVGIRLGDIREGKTKEDLKNNTISEILDTIIYPTLQPTHDEPTVTLSSDILDGLADEDEVIKDGHLLISIEKLLKPVDDESELDEDLTGGTVIYNTSSTYTQTIDGVSVEYPYDLIQTVTYNPDKTLSVEVIFDWKDGEPSGMVEGSLLINGIHTQFEVNDGVRTCTTTEIFEYGDELNIDIYVACMFGIVENIFNYVVGSDNKRITYVKSYVYTHTGSNYSDNITIDDVEYDISGHPEVSVTYNEDKTLTISNKFVWDSGYEVPNGFNEHSCEIVIDDEDFYITTSNDGVYTCTTTNTFESEDKVEILTVTTYKTTIQHSYEDLFEYVVGSGELTAFEVVEDIESESDFESDSESESEQSEEIITVEDILDRLNDYDELVKYVTPYRGKWTYPTAEYDEDGNQYTLYNYTGKVMGKDDDTPFIYIDDNTPTSVTTLNKNLDSRYTFGVSLFFKDGPNPRDNKRNLARYDNLIDTCTCKDGCEKCYIPPFYAQYIHSNILTVDVVYPVYMNYISDTNKSIKDVIRHPLIDYHDDGGGVAYVEIPAEVDGYNSDMPCKLCIDAPQHLDVEVYQYNELCHTYDVSVDIDWIYSEVKFNTMYNRYIRTKNKYDTNIETVKYKIVFKKK